MDRNKTTIWRGGLEGVAAGMRRVPQGLQPAHASQSAPAATAFDARATAIMPAERLLPAWRAAQGGGLPPARAVRRTRRLGYVLATALGLATAALFLPTGQTPGIKAVRLPPLRAARADNAHGNKQVMNQRQVSQPPPRTLPRGAERAALDALIAGDLPRAHQPYAELARARQGDPTYATLERILSQRVTTPR